MAFPNTKRQSLLEEIARRVIVQVVLKERYKPEMRLFLTPEHNKAYAEIIKIVDEELGKEDHEQFFKR